MQDLLKKWKENNTSVLNIEGLLLYSCTVNKDALSKILETGNMWRYSMSNEVLQEVGASSGKYELVREIRTNCNLDALAITVEQTKPFACHEGYASCFYRKLENGVWVIDKPRIVDPKAVYKK